MDCWDFGFGFKERAGINPDSPPTTFSGAVSRLESVHTRTCPLFFIHLDGRRRSLVDQLPALKSQPFHDSRTKHQRFPELASFNFETHADRIGSTSESGDLKLAVQVYPFRVLPIYHKPATKIQKL